eukprot:TRINITY_DN1596_c0_g1_i1.p3 TRINITY_DN1596_c0_g1~~TRINITY_DN1596_c0_g1_i1.p3  ORF type:complete len:110 (+),score=23.23 TRINITY_DN1596_c0_g1_i1:82-411(+)
MDAGAGGGGASGLGPEEERDCAAILRQVAAEPDAGITLSLTGASVPRPNQSSESSRMPADHEALLQSPMCALLLAPTPPVSPSSKARVLPGGVHPTDVAMALIADEAPS